MMALLGACSDGGDEGACVECNEFDWPERLSHTSVVEFLASSQAKNLGYTDCGAIVHAELDAFDVPDACPGCDQGYTGSLEYEMETCSAQVGMSAPSSASFGMIAWGDDWEVFGEEPPGMWTRVARTRLEEDGSRVLERTETVFVDGPIGQVNAGQLRATMTFVIPE